ncbi:hypothetical protein N7471_013008 [Penicillium samsonianum]|uniref:uncharacterized protein n=1 Tax=Penicillium samsonianum TaxID=1882272 RepID=UPI002547870C|nr:uncharacterized protein N7471_013008 [Penicillium samsonianum]KAJ6119057.1 hypothetical protein N7471_013008 [Penicillium samsonianum]
MGRANANDSLGHNVEVEDYTKRPPYLLQPLQEFGEIKWHAQCQCGEVKYALRRERPLNAKFCHCRQCQVLHGAPFQWAAIFPKEDIRFEKGTEGLSFYAAGEKNNKYQTPTKPDEQRHRVQTFLPTCHIFYENRLRDIHDGITKWSGMDEQSQQLDDDGQPQYWDDSFA